MKQKKWMLVMICFTAAAACSKAFSQAGAGTKYGDNYKAYTDSIKNSDYIWTFPAWGKRISKKGFDIPYSAGIMLNPYGGSQEVNISDLSVGFNSDELVPLDFIEFGKVKASIRSITVRPDVWVLPFLDLYAIAGMTSAQTDVSVVAPIDFSTQADFSGTTFGLGATFAVGFHGIITIVDINHSWTNLSGITSAVQTNMFTPRLGYNFLFRNKPWRSLAVWVGAPGIFVNRTTEGTIDLKDLSPSGSTIDLENIVNEVSGWYNDLPPAQKIVVKQIAQAMLDKLNGLDVDGSISYSLKKRAVSNWSMSLGGQFQVNHRWQVRTEVGFLGGRKSMLISGNYRFRL